MDNLSKRRVVTVDGLAGSGKTSIAGELAKRTGFALLNSGLLYRAVGWMVIENGGSPGDVELSTRMAKEHRYSLREGGLGVQLILVDGVPITADLTCPQISEAASQVASYPGVREALLGAQRDAFPDRGLIAEGRDMGTVLFPDAPAKFFVTAPVDLRVARRMAQLLAKSPTQGTRERDNLEAEISREIIDRDARDSTRAISPTKPASDSVLIDNSVGSLTEVVDRMYDSLLARGIVSRA